MDIVVVNAHWNNRGDEAAHRALWDELCRRYPESRITVMFKDRQKIVQFPEMRNTNYFSCQFKAASWDIWLCALTRGFVGRNLLLKKAVRTLKTADLIIYPPGGSVINDRFFWSKQMEYLVPFLCARLYRIPMFVAAPSIGPFEKPRRLRNWLLKTPKVFCVREDVSKDYLETIGIRDNVHVTMDLAFMDLVDAEANKKKLDEYSELKKFMGSHKKTVGMTISDFKWHVKLRKNPELIKQIEDAFRKMVVMLEKNGFGVLLIPQLFGNQNDMEYLKTFATNANTFVMSDEPDTYFQQHVISKLYAVIGMRYHCNIFAAKMGTPFIAVSYEEKMDGFLKLADLTDYGISVNKVTFERLERKFQLLQDNHEALRKKLRNDANAWRENARRTIELLSSVK